LGYVAGFVWIEGLNLCHELDVGDGDGLSMDIHLYFLPFEYFRRKREPSTEIHASRTTGSRCVTSISRIITHYNLLLIPRSAIELKTNHTTCCSARGKSHGVRINCRTFHDLLMSMILRMASRVYHQVPLIRLFDHRFRTQSEASIDYGDFVDGTSSTANSYIQFPGYDRACRGPS
jgi:hypothetical protein